MFIAVSPACGCTCAEHPSEHIEKVVLDTATVRWLDVFSYMGKWYEIARYENSFERGLSHVSATYSMDDDGDIRIVNEGFRNGKWYKSLGKGKYPQPELYPGRLRVSFFLWFYSDYYILELDERAYTYAVVGSSSDKYLWILYRDPVMSQSLLTDLLERIEKRGYDTSKLIFVNQESVEATQK
ncbi:MAG: lipocalin family protein [Bacteroidaceae bacterium]|nr:lipocalin family protein [Bacteroidaceae bacterium]